MDNQSQMITRRVYNNDGSILREGLVPKDLKNDKKVLLDYWAAEDVRIASEEAVAAEVEAEKLAAMADAANENPIPSIIGRIDEAESVLDQHADLISQLSETIGGLSAATPEQIIQTGVLLTGASAAALAVEAAAEKSIGEIKVVSEEARATLDELKSQSVEDKRQIADLVVGARQQLEATSAQIISDTKKQIANLVNTTTARVESLRGPKGNSGNPGASTVIGSGVPKGANILVPLIDRGAIKGDVYIDGSDENRRAYRWDGNLWESGPAMATIQVRDVKISALDNSQKVYPTVSSPAPGGLSGGGGEPFLTRSIGGALGTTLISNSGRWVIPLNRSGLSSPTSCECLLELTAADGPLTGRKLYQVSSVLFEAGSVAGVSKSSVYSEMGDLQSSVDVDLSLQSMPVVIPASVTMAMPTGLNCLGLWLNISKNLSGSNNFIVAGAVEWVIGKNTVASQTGALSIVPAWNLI